jgi:glycerol-3-phosphate dehydrogenase
MARKNYRTAFNQLQPTYDVLIIGGGITGAGILREAVRMGLSALLVEQRDFAWGTSSRSSKLVHGGLRYLKEGRIFLTRASVLEREQLLNEGPGLIDPLGFLLSIHKGDSPGRWTFEAGLTVYDLLALRWGHNYYSPQEFRMLAPHVSHHGLEGGFRYGDAQTDDARLVLRVLREAVAAGGTALNYVQAEQLLKDESGQVTGAILGDVVSGKTREVRAQLVINATGAWADKLREQVDAEPKIRPLRGSHLIFPAWRVPAAQAMTFLHPIDRRPVFVFPWEGVTLVGTTDVDYDDNLSREPSISPEEVAYLMAAVEGEFPSLHLTLDDVVATFAGVRPVIGSGQSDPSKESRDHVVWNENGLLTVTGGKLTTFRIIARDALKSARQHLPELPELSCEVPVLDKIDLPLPENYPLDQTTWRRLLGRYGAEAPSVVAAAQPGELELIPGTSSLWAELRHAARTEDVLHLEDLLLRRVRIGLVLPNGGADCLPRIRKICQPELGWDDDRWLKEEQAYLELTHSNYNLPDHNLIPDWKTQLAEARQKRQTAYQDWLKKRNLLIGIFAAIGAALGTAIFWFWRRKES